MRLPVRVSDGVDDRSVLFLDSLPLGPVIGPRQRHLHRAVGVLDRLELDDAVFDPLIGVEDERIVFLAHPRGEVVFGHDVRAALPIRLGGVCHRGFLGESRQPFGLLDRVAGDLGVSSRLVDGAVGLSPRRRLR